MKLSRAILVASILVSISVLPNLASTPLSAQEAAEVPTMEQQLADLVDLATRISEVEHRYAVDTISCGEFVHLLGSGQQHDQAVAAVLMTWAHGYVSGLHGVDFVARPVDLEGMVEITRQIVEECRKDPDALFHVAASRLK